MKIIFIGAGNLASGLSLEMQRVGMTIIEIYSRSSENASALAKKLNCKWTTDLGNIRPDADLYIFALSDSVLQNSISMVKPNGGVWVHTAGSMPSSIFEGYAKRYGVFYPLQTFTKSRRVNLDGTPIFVEANRVEDIKMLKKVAGALSGNAREIEFEKRIYLHLAAVFASNFTNHLYDIAAEILEEHGLSYESLIPLMIETAEKIRDISPAQAQTGPAVRFDKNVMDRQCSMLSTPHRQLLYKLLSQSIYSETIK